MGRNIILFFCVFFGFLGLNHTILAQNSINNSTGTIETQNVPNTQKIILSLFLGNGCPHCEKEKKFLETMKIKYPNLVVNEYEIWHNKENVDILEKVAKKINVNVSGVPFTIIGEKTISGYFDDSTTGKEIEKGIEYCQTNICEDIVGPFLKKEEGKNQSMNNGEYNTPKNKGGLEKITLPFFGEMNLKDYSLPIITIIFGALDGFNPCAMWVLLFLMSMLIGMNDRAKMWILGTAFILSSAIAYFLFMTAWLSIILFIGFTLLIRVSIGLFAIGGGSWNVWQYFKSKDSGCAVVEEEKRTKVFEKIRNILHQKSFFVALIGICVLAFAVNILELLCSAGLPVIYTQILTLNNLSTLQHYLYILLYIFFFMLDDLIIFGIGMITLQITGFSTKYTKYSHLVGGILMIIVGILLIFKHEVLMFG